MNHSQADIERWAAELNKEIYAKCKSYKWKYGIKTFYGPLEKNSPLCLISYQPGGRTEYQHEDMDRFERGDFGLPKTNAYLTVDNKMAQKIRELFDSCNNLDLINKCAVFPLIFFRAPSDRVWRRKIGKNRSEAESFCFQKVNEIIKKLRPKKIVVFGIKTCDIMQAEGMLAESPQKVERSTNGDQRIVLTFQANDYRAFAMSHPSSAHIRKEDWQTIKKLFGEWLL